MMIRRKNTYWIVWTIFILLTLGMAWGMVAALIHFAFPFLVLPAEKLSALVGLVLVFALFLLAWRLLAAWFRLTLLLITNEKQK